MSDAGVSHDEYRRLLKMLTLRAYRFLGFATAAGTDPVLGELGLSPEDFAVAVLGKWLVGQLRFFGDRERLPAFLTKVMTRDILEMLRKRGVKLSRSGKTVSLDEVILLDPGTQSSPESLWDIRKLVREERFMAALRECTADDSDLQEFVYAVSEWDSDGVPAPREIADLLGVPTIEVQNRKRKLARRLVKHGVQLPATGRQL